MSTKIDLNELGLSAEIKREYEENNKQYFLGRVSVEHKNLYKVITQNGEIRARISGKLEYQANFKSDFPAVGDWVVLDRDDNKKGEAIIQGILPRKSKFSRKTAGTKYDEQVVAANVDIIFLCMALNNDFNLRRLERYISLAWDSGARPIIILTKADLCDTLDMKVMEVEQIALGIDIVVVSSTEKTGIDKVLSFVKAGQTIAFIGSSGVGKSTLINTLIGEERQKVNDIRKDDKGKHTTTYRELIKLPRGGIVIDTPGMREIHLLDDKEGIKNSFADIEELASSCKFSDCSHTTEPGCRVREAIEKREIPLERYESYLKLIKEAEYVERKLAKNDQREHERRLTKVYNSHQRAARKKKLR